MTTEDKGHSPIGASTRYRWRACPGSVRQCKNIEAPPPSEAAAEGTLAHEIAAYRLTEGKWPDGCTAEMQAALQIYIDEIEKVLATLTKKGDNQYLIEHGFALPQLHPDAWGTADCVIWDSVKKILYVFDLKYGQGIFVDAQDNEQLEYYAVGAFLDLDLPAKEVVLKIVQPRYECDEGPVREQRFKADKLLECAADIEAEAKATDDPNAPLVSGGHCRFCVAAGTCPLLAKEAQAVAKIAFATANFYDPQKLADTLDKLPMLEAFVKQVREFAYNEAIKGRLPPNYKLVAKRAQRSFDDEDGVRKYLAKVFKTTEEMQACYTPPKEPELKSPTQVEKVLPKKHHAGLAQFIKAESSGNKLVHNTEPGEPIMLDAKSVFTELDSNNTEDLFT